MQLRHLVIVMPAHNEAEGLPSFLADIREHTEHLAEKVSIVVVDDLSTDSTAAVVEKMRTSIPNLTVVASPINLGHGPTALAAYREGLALQPDVIVHVDGDGQFVGRDFPKLVGGLADGDVVHGVRQQRTDPWFRKVLTGIVGALVALLCRHRIPDVNTPLRAYRAVVVEQLLEVCPADALVPHVHFSIAEQRLGLNVRYLRVLSIPRRGTQQSGTMFGDAVVPALPSGRLLSFVLKAAVEVWRYSIRPKKVAM